MAYLLLFGELPTSAQLKSWGESTGRAVMAVSVLLALLTVAMAVVTA